MGQTKSPPIIAIGGIICYTIYMGKYVHRMSEVNKETKKALCSNCGYVDIRIVPCSGQILCRNKIHENKQKYRHLYKKGERLFKAKIKHKNKSLQCDICKKECKTFYDHDHTTGKFRGWLCVRCNFMLGYSKDSIETLKKAIKYLKNN